MKNSFLIFLCLLASAFCTPIFAQQLIVEGLLQLDSFALKNDAAYVLVRDSTGIIYAREIGSLSNAQQLTINGDTIKLSAGGFVDLRPFLELDQLTDAQFDGSNLSLGTQAGEMVSPNNRNLFIGFKAGNQTGSGSDNLSIGYHALEKNTDKSKNLAIGNYALQHADGFSNVAIGYSAMKMNIDGGLNIAIGEDALSDSLIGDFNIAIGVRALKENKSGKGNIAFGLNSMELAQDGLDNIGIGAQAMHMASGGKRSVAIGQNTISHLESGSDNIGIGNLALFAAQNAERNIAIGTGALDELVLGNSNVGIGASALSQLESGNNNVVIGPVAAISIDTINNGISIGYLSNVTQDNSVRIGAAFTNSIGGFADWTNFSDGRFKKNIEHQVPGLDFILKLDPVTYQLDMDAISTFYGIPDTLRDLASERDQRELTHTGFIAQDVASIAQSIDYEFSGVDVPRNNKTAYGIRYGQFAAPLVKAVQELHDENIKLKNDVTALKYQFQLLTTMLSEFQKKFDNKNQ